MDTLTTMVIGAASGIATFFAAWCGKHLLDWKVKPKIADWWARKDKARALKRADFLIAKFERDQKRIPDPVLLLVGLRQRLNAVFMLIAVQNTVTLGILVFQSSHYLGTEDVAALWMFFAAVAGVYAHGKWKMDKHYAGERDFRRNPEEYMNDLKRRISNLLDKDGISDDDKSARLQRLVKEEPV